MMPCRFDVVRISGQGGKRIKPGAPEVSVRSDQTKRHLGAGDHYVVDDAPARVNFFATCAGQAVGSHAVHLPSLACSKVR